MTATDADIDDATALIEHTIERYRRGDVSAPAKVEAMVPPEVPTGRQIDWLEKVAEGARNGSADCQRLALEAVGRLRDGSR